jgi:hypothetical protein
MRINRIILLLLLALVLLVSASLTGSTSTVRASDNGCDPTFQILRLCKLRGGTFDTGCCCCVLP